MPARKPGPGFEPVFDSTRYNMKNVGAGLRARPQTNLFLFSTFKDATGMNSLPQRKQLRLKNYDYGQPGYYFVTICTYEKQKILCHIDLSIEGVEKSTIKHTEIGLKVEHSLLNIPTLFSGVSVDQYIIMPNHLHLIIVLTKTGGHGDPPLHDIIGRFKSFTTREFNIIKRTKGKLLWQRNYYEHVIRDEDELNSTRQYIIDNPAKWHEDKYYTLI
ncbi:MAG: transposase [Bacillota bacterium]